MHCVRRMEVSGMRTFFLLAALLLLTPAASWADATPSPHAVPGLNPDSVKILGCSLEYSERSSVADKFHVDFINLNTLPVTHIRFRINAGSTFAVMDIGNFAPNVKIHHDLDPPAVGVVPVLPEGMNSMDCSVDAFTLSDGSTYISPQLQQELQAQQH